MTKQPDWLVIAPLGMAAHEARERAVNKALFSIKQCGADEADGVIIAAFRTKKEAEAFVSEQKETPLEA